MDIVTARRMISGPVLKSLNGECLVISAGQGGRCPSGLFVLTKPLKRERISRRASRTRDEARQDLFDDIAKFHNPKRKQARNGMLSPVEFERRQKMRYQGVQEAWGYSKAGSIYVHKQQCRCRNCFAVSAEFVLLRPGRGGDGFSR
jgi:putative transposase